MGAEKGELKNLILHLFDCETVRRKKFLLINIISEPPFFLITLTHLSISNSLSIFQLLSRFIPYVCILEGRENGSEIK